MGTRAARVVRAVRAVKVSNGNTVPAQRKEQATPRTNTAAPDVVATMDDNGQNVQSESRANPQSGQAHLIEKNRGGRPSLYTDAVIKTICANIILGMPLRAAAEYAGVAYETMRQWQRFDEGGVAKFAGFSDKIALARRQRAKNLLLKATALAAHDGRTALRLLELSDPQNFAPASLVKHQVSGQVDVEHRHTHEIMIPPIGASSREQLLHLLSRPALPAPMPSADDTGFIGSSEHTDLDADADWTIVDEADAYQDVGTASEDYETMLNESSRSTYDVYYAEAGEAPDFAGEDDPEDDAEDE